MNTRLLVIVALLPTVDCVAETLDSTPTPSSLVDAPNLDDGVPDPVDAYLTEFDRALLEQVGMELHRGDDPPLIEGTFFLDSLLVAWDDDGHDGWNVVQTWVEFSQQREDASLSCATWDDGESSSQGMGGYVSGTGDCFSAYIEQEYYSVGDDCTVQMPMVWSGCLADGDVEDLAMGFIAVERSGDCHDTVREGHRRMVVEDDGLAERVNAS